MFVVRMFGVEWSIVCRRADRFQANNGHDAGEP
jgi:hypothetical protein